MISDFMEFKRCLHLIIKVSKINTISHETKKVEKSKSGKQ